jgi:hypothetical protein
MSGPIWLMPILESALGIENAFAIAKADESVVALTIGLEDYTADLGVVKTLEGAESLYARTRLVNASKAAGIQAIDSVFGDVADIDGLRQWGARSRALDSKEWGASTLARFQSSTKLMHRRRLKSKKRSGSLLPTKRRGGRTWAWCRLARR